jgi:hypothetical protein
MNRPVLLIASPYDEATLKAIRDGFSLAVGLELDCEVVEDNKLIAAALLPLLTVRCKTRAFLRAFYEIGRQLSE